jgi:TRAP-type mannitol/chloroaromatic compound transport system substrate-binding protein
MAIGQKSIDPKPAIILFLLATSVLFFSLYVQAVAQKQNTPQTSHENGSSKQNIEFKWRLVTSWPKNFPGLGSAPEFFAREVKRMSNGRMQVTVHGAGEVVPPLGVFDAVSNGTVEMGHSGAYYWKGKVPASQFFTAIPFGLNAQEMNSWLYHGGGMELWREIYAPHNLVPLAGGNTGVQMAGWFNKEINSVDDLKGLKMRIPGLGGEVLTRLGGTAVNIPGGELFTSLQTGVIDATEWVGPYNDLTFGLHQAATYYYYPGWHEPGPVLEFTVHQAAWDSLPEDLRAIVENAARAANQDMLDLYTAKNNEALEELINTHHVQVRRLPDDVLAEFRRVSDEVLAEFVASDPLADKVYRSMRAFQQGVQAYHKVSEKAYYETRGEIRESNP